MTEQGTWCFQFLSEGRRKNMLKLIGSLLLLSLFIVVAGFVYLSGTDMPQPKVQIEKTIDNNQFFQSKETKAGGF